MGVCVSVYRTDDRASLQRLVFNMQDSDIVKFDDHIHHNETLDHRTRLALYSKIRQQVVRNFERANRSHKNPVCRYCQVAVGPVNDYVAFVVFSETVEFNTSASQDDSVQSAAAADKSTAAEKNANLGKSESKFHQAGKDVSKPADRLEVKAQNQEIIGEIVQCKSEKKTEVMPVGRKVPKRQCKNVTTSGSEATQSYRAGRRLAHKQVDNVTEVSNRENHTHEVVGKTETDVKKKSATVDDLSIEPVDEYNLPDEPDGMMNREQLDVTNKQDVPKQSNATEKVLNLPREDFTVEISGQLGAEMDEGSKLCLWQKETILQLNASADVKNIEFKKLSDWLFLRMSLTTAVHRFPLQYDMPVLGPRENPEQSVTWRLAEKFSPYKPTAEADVPLAIEQTLKGGKAASHVVFIGPYDRNVIRQREVVQRRVAQIIDDLLPHSSADIFCITDVGRDINMSCVDDIVISSKLPTAAQFCAYTASDAEFTPVSCVLLRFSPLTE